MDWVSFDEIKNVVSLEMVIDRYGILLRRLNATTLRGQCPLPMHGSEQSKESFTATLNKGVGGAWACQSKSCAGARGRIGGNVLDFVAAMEKCSVRDAAIKLQMWFLVPAAGQPRADGKEPRAEISAGKEPEEKNDSRKFSEPEGVEPNKPLTFKLQNLDYEHPYLAERGVDEEAARKFGIAFFSGKGTMHDRVVIPIHNEFGELVAYAGRAIDASDPRYKFPAGFRKSQELYNLHRVRNEISIVIVEGFFDCLRVSDAGYACVALMGSTMSRVQEELIAKYFAHVVLMLDGDEAGQTAGEEILDRLSGKIFAVQRVALDRDVQPDTLSCDQLHELLGQEMEPGLIV
jgi:DNA primase